MLVVLEGVDKSGKQTQSRLLAAHFERAKVFSFPRYDTPLGELIKRHLAGRVQLSEKHTVDSSDIRIDCDTYWCRDDGDALAFQCLMMADRYAAASEIRYRQEHGLVTICDRYWPSGYAYGVADGLDPAWLVEVYRALPQPDTCVLVDLPVETALDRGRTGRPDVADRYEKDSAKLRRVRENYLQLWADNPRWIRVDGAQSSDAVYAQILATVRG